MTGILERAKEFQDRMVLWRRHVHMYPEIGLETPKTAAFVADVLGGMGLSVRQKVGGHGVVAVLEGNSPGPVIAIRADMDALPMEELTGLPFASRNKGFMHACGHDGHVAIALGAAGVLSQVRHALRGSVKFMFQPAEEGPGGALPMISDGALEDPNVDAVVGLHLWVSEDFPSGAVGIRPGPLMAATDRARITIKGEGGHGAMPHEAVDALCVGAHVVTALQTVVSRRASPLQPVVITVGTFQAGTAANIIAEEATLECTVRCLDSDLHGRLPHYIEAVVRGICQAMGADYEFDYVRGYPVLENDLGFTAFFADVARSLLGTESVVTLREPTMGGEDMAYFLQKVPGTYFFLGSSPAGDRFYPHHNPRFDIDEDVFWIGAGLLAETALRWLNKE